MNNDQHSHLSAEFRQLVADELTALGYTVTEWQSDGLECRNSEGEARSLGLVNLFRKFKNADASEQPNIIRNFLSVLDQTHQLQDGELTRLAEVADRLMPRLGKPFPEGSVAPWCQELLGTDLIVNLVVDSDHYMQYVTQEQMEASGREPNDWLNIAFKNLKRSTPEDWLTVVHEESGVLCGHCNDSYDAARAIVLHHLLDTTPLGWMVAVPTRDLVFTLPVNRDKLSYFHILKILAVNHYNEDAYPISDKVYWVRGLAWEEFTIEHDDDGAKVYPSEEFIDLLGLNDSIEEE